MNVKVVLEHGAIWHNKRAYLFGDVISGLDDAIAMRLVKNSSCIIDDSSIDAQTGEIPTSESKSSKYVYDTEELVSSMDTQDVKVDEVECQVEDTDSDIVDGDDDTIDISDDSDSVDDAVSSILDTIVEKRKRGRPRK